MIVYLVFDRFGYLCFKTQKKEKEKNVDTLIVYLSIGIIVEVVQMVSMTMPVRRRIRQIFCPKL
jgi:hypothetical protein